MADHLTVQHRSSFEQLFYIFHPWMLVRNKGIMSSHRHDTHTCSAERWSFDNINPSTSACTCYWCCKLINLRYALSSFSIRLECVPCSMILPSSNTDILSAFLIVESLCATTIVVLPFITLSSASWTTHSDSASSALVASSRSNIAGLLMMARAMATRCFWPPESWTPRSPTFVW